MTDSVVNTMNHLDHGQFVIDVRRTPVRVLDPFVGLAARPSTLPLSAVGHAP